MLHECGKSWTLCKWSYLHMHRAQIAISWACCTAALYRMPPDSLWASKIVADEFTSELAVEADCMVCPVTWYEMGRCFRMMVYDDLGMRAILEVPSKKKLYGINNNKWYHPHRSVPSVFFSLFHFQQGFWQRYTIHCAYKTLPIFGLEQICRYSALSSVLHLHSTITVMTVALRWGLKCRFLFDFKFRNLSVF